MFLRKLSSSSSLFNRSINLISSCKQSIARHLNNDKVMKSNYTELYPFDYDKIPNDFDDEIYQQMINQEDAFDVHRLVNLKELFDNRCHFGHKTGSLNDFMKPYLYGHRQDIAIFDLNQTVEHLKRALNFVAHIAFRDGIVLFVNPAREVSYFII